METHLLTVSVDDSRAGLSIICESDFPRPDASNAGLFTSLPSDNNNVVRCAEFRVCPTGSKLERRRALVIADLPSPKILAECRNVDPDPNGTAHLRVDCFI